MSLCRLPVYILADVSGSMRGTPVESVKAGIRQLHRDLLTDPQAIWWLGLLLGWVAQRYGASAMLQMEAVVGVTGVVVLLVAVSRSRRARPDDSVSAHAATELLQSEL